MYPCVSCHDVNEVSKVLNSNWDPCNLPALFNFPNDFIIQGLSLSTASLVVILFCQVENV